MTRPKRYPNKGKLIAFRGKAQTLTAWAKELGMSLDTLYVRINRLKWDIERALTQPVGKWTRSMPA